MEHDVTDTDGGIVDGDGGEVAWDDGREVVRDGDGGEAADEDGGVEVGDEDGGVEVGDEDSGVEVGDEDGGVEVGDEDGGVEVGDEDGGGGDDDAGDDDGVGTTCGNGVREGSEECDDGNADDTDACVGCALAFCGDGHAWEGEEECDGDAPRACTTSCSSRGAQPCLGSCVWDTGCTPPAEVCNGLDDDCDFATDEDFPCIPGAPVACTTECSSVGVGACTVSCGVPPPAECTPPAEICNGLDDDCDGSPEDPCVVCTTTTMTFGSEGVGTADSYIDEIAPGTNYGSAVFVLAGSTTRTPAGLFSFDLGYIPGTAIVCGAIVHVHMYNNNACRVFSFYQVMESWDEATVTWNERSAGVSWFSAGCGPGSCGETAVGSFIPDCFGPCTGCAGTSCSTTVARYDVPIATWLVQGWVDGSMGNHGIAWKGTASDSAALRSSESGCKLPTIEVTFVP